MRYDFPPAYQRLLIGSLPLPTRLLLLRVRRSAPASAEVACRPGPLLVPATRRSGSSHVDACGISQVFRRSIPCLCSVPGPRSNRRDLASRGHLDAAPAERTAKASANLISGLTRSFGTCCHTLHADIAAHVQGSLPGGWLAFLRMGVEPIGPRRGVSARVHVHPPLLLS